MARCVPASGVKLSKILAITSLGCLNQVLLNISVVDSSPHLVRSIRDCQSRKVFLVDAPDSRPRDRPPETSGVDERSFLSGTF